MKTQRFTEEQIKGGLRGQEAGAKAADLCRKHGKPGAVHLLTVSSALVFVAISVSFRGS